MQVLNYSPALRITNLGQLPPGTGAKYLQVLVSHNGDLVACQWHRTMPRELRIGRALVQFTRSR